MKGTMPTERQLMNMLYRKVIKSIHMVENINHKCSERTVDKFKSKMISIADSNKRSKNAQRSWTSFIKIRT